MVPSELGHRAMVINATDRRALLLQTPTTPAHPAAPAAGQLRLGRGRGAFGQGRAEGRTGARRRASPPAGHCQAAPGPARRGAGAPRSPGRGGRRRPTARAPGAGPAASFRAQSTSVLRYGGSAGGAGGEGGVEKKEEKNPRRGTRQKHVFLSLPLPGLAWPSAAEGAPGPRRRGREPPLGAATPDPPPDPPRRERELPATQHRRRLPAPRAGLRGARGRGGGRAAAGTAPRPPSVSGRGGAGRGWRRRWLADAPGGGAEAGPEAGTAPLRH